MEIFIWLVAIGTFASFIWFFMKLMDLGHSVNDDVAARELQMQIELEKQKKPKIEPQNKTKQASPPDKNKGPNETNITYE